MTVMGRSVPLGKLAAIHLALLLLGGCSNPLNYEVAKMTRDQLAALHQVLTADQTKNLDAWIDRNTAAGKSIPAGVTVDRALREQAAWLAQRKAEEAQADELKKTLQAQRAAKQQEMARMLTVTLVSKTNKVQRDNRRFVAFELAYENKTDKDIQSVDGVLKLSNVYGAPVIDIGWLYSRGIPAKHTVAEHEAGIFVNKAIEPQVEFWNTDFERLKYTFEVKSIIFKDGTSVNASP